MNSIISEMKKMLDTLYDKEGVKYKIRNLVGEIELTEYEKPVIRLKPNSGRTKATEGPSERKKENRSLTIRRGRNKVKALCLRNFDSESKHVTLTFSEHITDIKDASKILTNFTRRMIRLSEKKGNPESLKYIIVMEFHDSGRIHFHMVANLQRITANELEAKWGLGKAEVKDIESRVHLKNIGRYLGKNFADIRLQALRKLYWRSKSLEEPEVTLSNDENAGELRDLLKSEEKVFTRSYPDDHRGQTTYSLYNNTIDPLLLNRLFKS